MVENDINSKDDTIDNIKGESDTDVKDEDDSDNEDAETESIKEQSHPKDEKSSSKNTITIKKQTIMLMGVAVIALIVIAFVAMPRPTGYVAATGAAEVGASAGDTITVKYIGKLIDGSVFDEGELTFELGAGQMIAGFDSAVVGMELGDEKTVSIPPEGAYGEYDESQMMEIPRVQELQKLSSIPYSTLSASTTNEVKEGAVFYIEAFDWEIKILKIDGDNVTFENQPPAVGTVINPQGQPWPYEISELTDETIEVTALATEGASISTAMGELRVSEITDEMITLDMNHKLAGETLVFDIEVTGLEKPKKYEKPELEIFIMSYCPYGLQMAKAVVPVAELLGDKADIKIKFVNYAMHGKEEIDENTRMNCIQEEQLDVFWAYMGCFLGSGDVDACLATAKVDTAKLDSCMARTDEQFGLTESFQDQSTWTGGRYPPYKVHDADNLKYSVQGSPTVILNGKSESVARSPEAVKEAVCNAFVTAPEECSQMLSTASSSPGFGYGAGADTLASCG